MDTAITVILPVHNVERTLRATIVDILEHGPAAGRRFDLVVLDDGSTDETFEAACELASVYPQVHVVRQPLRSGLGAGLELVRRRLPVSHAIVHDGVGPIDVQELVSLMAGQSSRRAPAREAADDGRGSRRFAAVASLNAHLAAAHRKVASFQWLRLQEDLTPRRVPSAGRRAESAGLGVPIALASPATTFAPAFSQ